MFSSSLISLRWIRVLRRASSPACVQIGRCTVQHTRQTHQKIQMTDKCTSHIAAEHTQTQFCAQFFSPSLRAILNLYGLALACVLYNIHTPHIHTHEISISRYFNRRRVSLRLFLLLLLLLSLFDCIMLSVYFRFSHLFLFRLLRFVMRLWVAAMEMPWSSLNDVHRSGDVGGGGGDDIKFSRLKCRSIESNLVSLRMRFTRRK